MSMMTHTFTVAKKIIQPVVLGIAMLFMTPVAGMLNAALRAPPPVEISSNESVIYKTMHAAVVFKG